ncbi:hypothetical protein TSUD_189410 [Trifolium subterraneum]|uniref:Uncharacterized protein n=1 Tax=Trifolium subterraneum TaxID=3900 RepID=A0A2Z6LQK5_TRISU|nr:hypothetical protein TSUD_189410 [Trifolium subterraneum]
MIEARRAKDIHPATRSSLFHSFKESCIEWIGAFHMSGDAYCTASSVKTGRRLSGCSQGGEGVERGKADSRSLDTIL